MQGVGWMDARGKNVVKENGLKRSEGRRMVEEGGQGQKKKKIDERA